MKILLTGIGVILTFIATAQQGNELIVYAIKGNATVINNREETPAKIGRVLKQNMSLKVEEGARLTLICRQGKALSVAKAGLIPLSYWKDSCRADYNSITSNYLQYVWSELYHRSKEYREEAEKYGTLGVTRGDGKDDGMDYPPGMVFIEFPTGLDTLAYVSGDFPLTWRADDFRGHYQFQLYTAKTRQLIFKDSVRTDNIAINRFNKKLKPGTRYAWTITAPAKTGVIRRRIIDCVPAERLTAFIDSVQKSVGFEETAAALFFRTAYFLEKKHFLVQAHQYYQKAAGAEPDNDWYQEKLHDFRFQYRLDELAY